MPGPPAAGIEALASDLNAGETLPVALERSGRWLPTLDRQVIAAAAEAGRLPDALRRLAARHASIVRTRIALALATAYPVVVLHLGALAFPIQVVVTDGVIAYAAAVARVLVPLWLAVAAAFVAIRLRWRVALGVLDLLPFVRAHRRARGLADLAFALETLLTAGVRIDRAWQLAATATDDRRLDAVARAAMAAVGRGEAVAPVLAVRREIPRLFAEYYRTGESTGRLDDALARLQLQFSDTASMQLKLAGMAYPALLFAAVAAWVAVRIVLFYAGHFRQIEDLTR